MEAGVALKVAVEVEVTMELEVPVGGRVQAKESVYVGNKSESQA